MKPKTLKALSKHPEIDARVERFAVGLLESLEVREVHPSWMGLTLEEAAERIRNEAAVSTMAKNAIHNRAYWLGKSRLVLETLDELLNPGTNRLGKKGAAELLRAMSKSCSHANVQEGR